MVKLGQASYSKFKLIKLLSSIYVILQNIDSKNNLYLSDKTPCRFVWDFILCLFLETNDTLAW